VHSLKRSSPNFDWQAMGDWRLVLPPSRPSSDHLEYVKRVASALARNSPVAVLGSTVEYRDLLSDLGFSRVYIFEKNSDFYRFVSRLSTRDLSEEFVEGDWLTTLDNYRGCFELVLSHLTLGNIAYSNREEFYLAVSSSLSDSGVFVDYVLSNEPGYIKLSEINRKFLGRPVNIHAANEFSCQALFCSELVEKMRAVDTRKIYDELYRSLDPKLEPLIDLAQYVTPIGGYWYYGRAWEVEAAERSSFFEATSSDTETSPSPYANRAMHQILTNNGERHEQHN